MTQAPKGFRQQPKQKAHEVEIEVKRATAENLAQAHGVVDQRRAALNDAEQLLAAQMRTILTENGIQEAVPVKILDTNPPRLVLNVIKYVKPDKPLKKK